MMICSFQKGVLSLIEDCIKLIAHFQKNCDCFFYFCRSVKFSVSELKIMCTSAAGFESAGAHPTGGGASQRNLRRKVEFFKG